MSGSTQRFQINEPSVVSETIEGEVVIINLDKGTYYSLRETSAQIWGCLQAQEGTDAILLRLNQLYEGDSEQMRDDVARFLSQLVEEEIIRVEDGNSSVEAASPVEEPSSGEIPKKRPFEAPVLEKFTDMEHLLLLDPIHEVDETGWPNV